MNKKIVLCSNSIAVQKVVKWSLSNLDYEIVALSSKEETSDHLKRFTPDLFIIDQDLPRDEGLCLCNELRSSDIHSQIPIILLVKKQKKAGMEKVGGIEKTAFKADKVLFTPFESGDLEDSIAELFAGSSSEEGVQPKESSFEDKHPIAHNGTEPNESGIPEDKETREDEKDLWKSDLHEDIKEGELLGVDRSMAVWIKGIIQREIRRIIEDMVPDLTKEIVQEHLRKMIDQATLEKVTEGNRQFISKIMQDRAPDMINEIIERMVPDLAERTILSEIDRIKQGYE